MTAADEPTLADVRDCFEGVIPAVLATASADGVPNVTYLSKVRLVDDERVALSNQFFSKSTRNLAANPHASLLVVDADTQDEYRLSISYERTERRGPVFDQLRTDVDAIAAMTEVQDVFKLHAADIYRVTRVEALRVLGPLDGTDAAADPLRPDPGAGLGELSARLSRSTDLDTLVGVITAGLDELLGFEHSMLLLADEDGRRLFTIATHGYGTEGIGSEVVVGEGVIGMAAARCTPIRVGNLNQMAKYGSALRRTFEAHGEIGPGHEVPMPGLRATQSRLAVPAMALGQLVGVVVVESTRPGDFRGGDEAVLRVVASLFASAVETVRAEERAAEARAGAPATPAPTPPSRTAHVRFFPVDGSAFLDGDYLIKGVAGRLLWSLLRQHQDEGRVDFTNREVRLDPTLDLPDFRDNFESRLILLKRRLVEREAPIQIVKTGRGRFRLDVAATLRLEEMGAGGA